MQEMPSSVHNIGKMLNLSQAEVYLISFSKNSENT